MTNTDRIDAGAFNAAISQTGFNSQPALRMFLEAYLAALPADTAGWRMVPVEPDLGMYRALTKTLSETPEGKLFVAQWALGDFRESYQDMLTAAPPPPAGGKEG